MGKFFNTQAMNLKRIPGSKTMEQMRKDYNENLNASTLTAEPPKDIAEPIKERRKRRVRNKDGKLVRR